MPVKVEAQIEHELDVITDLRCEHYFLTVADIVRFARSRNILCQGRGSAANSAICYCIAVTKVDPQRMSMLFECFVSKEPNERPDIGIDFEHDRREQSLQYLYAKYGGDRSAMTMTFFKSGGRNTQAMLTLETLIVLNLPSRSSTRQGDRATAPSSGKSLS